MLAMRWVDLAFLHWRVRADDLRALVPAPLEIDAFDGGAWLGITPFRMTGVRPVALPPVPTARDFPELNVRTYVRLGSRAGVWFFSLDAASRLAVIGARMLTGLPYFHARMDQRRAGDDIRYESVRDARCPATRRRTCSSRAPSTSGRASPSGPSHAPRRLGGGRAAPHLPRMTAFQRTVDSFRQGAHTMPGERYTSAEIFAAEQERLFARHWNCVGRLTDFGRPGDYRLRTVAGESLILVRDRGGELHAFFNVCRHRGTQLCREERGQFSETIQCPYHAWTYALDGRLVGAPHMQEVAGFEKARYPLHEAAVAEWDGFIFVNVSREPRPFAEWFAPMLGRLARFELGALLVGHRARYEVAANWKLVFQNYSECLHCPMIHPELSLVLPYQSGANDLVSGPFLGGYMEIREPHESATLSGRACGRPVSGRAAPEDARRAYYYTLMPNMMLSVHPDYVNYYMLTPVAADRTIVESEWLFNDASADDPAFNPADAIDFWDVTNRQDWDICERSQAGIASRRYQPGPYSPRESIPAAWDEAYLRLMSA